MSEESIFQKSEIISPLAAELRARGYWISIEDCDRAFDYELPVIITKADYDRPLRDTTSGKCSRGNLNMLVFRERLFKHRYWKFDVMQLDRISVAVDVCLRGYIEEEIKSFQVVKFTKIIIHVNPARYWWMNYLGFFQFAVGYWIASGNYEEIKKPRIVYV